MKTKETPKRKTTTTKTKTKEAGTGTKRSAKTGGGKEQPFSALFEGFGKKRKELTTKAEHLVTSLRAVAEKNKPRAQFFLSNVKQKQKELSADAVHLYQDLRLKAEKTKTGEWLKSAVMKKNSAGKGAAKKTSPKKSAPHKAKHKS